MSLVVASPAPLLLMLNTLTHETSGQFAGSVQSDQRKLEAELASPLEQWAPEQTEIGRAKSKPSGERQSLSGGGC